MANQEQFVQTIQQGYTFSGASIIVGGAMLDSKPVANAQIKIPLKTLNRHGLIAGATGTGKTFTMANVIEKIQKPTLVIAHNKTLAAQLAQEFETFFPDAAVHYFVSYYDYYQPEAYMPITDTYIEKDAQINEEIDRLRHASTQALLTRSDVIIVASVSCIYGLGSPEAYEGMMVQVSCEQKLKRDDLLRELIRIQYNRNNVDFSRGNIRVRGDIVEVFMGNISFH